MLVWLKKRELAVWNPSLYFRKANGAWIIARQTSQVVYTHKMEEGQSSVIAPEMDSEPSRCNQAKLTLSVILTSPNDIFNMTLSVRLFMVWWFCVCML